MLMENNHLKDEDQNKISSYIEKEDFQYERKVKMFEESKKSNFWSLGGKKNKENRGRGKIKKKTEKMLNRRKT